MKKNIGKKIFVTVLLGAVLFGILWASDAHANRIEEDNFHFDAGLADVTRSITWDWVNVREQPNSHQTCLGQLYTGDRVQLTGNVYDDVDGSHVWVEIRWEAEDIQTAWVIKNAITPQGWSPTP